MASTVIAVIALAFISFVCLKLYRYQSLTLYELHKGLSEQGTAICNLTTELDKLKNELENIKATVSDGSDVVDDGTEKNKGRQRILGNIIHGTKELFKHNRGNL